MKNAPNAPGVSSLFISRSFSFREIFCRCDKSAHAGSEKCLKLLRCDKSAHAGSEVNRSGRGFSAARIIDTANEVCSQNILPPQFGGFVSSLVCFWRSNIISPWMQFCTDPYRGSNIITLRKRLRMIACACCNANISNTRSRFRIIARVCHESNLCHPEETVSRRGFLVIVRGLSRR